MFKRADGWPTVYLQEVDFLDAVGTGLGVHQVKYLKTECGVTQWNDNLWLKLPGSFVTIVYI